MTYLFIFDLDDTCMLNQEDFDLAEYAFVKVVQLRLGLLAPSKKELVDFEETIDRENIKLYGWARERYPTSCQQAYRYFCEELKLDPDPVGERMVYRAGMIAFNFKRWRKRGLMPGVQETLEFLITQGDKVALLTKGDLKVQKEKIESVYLEKWIHPDNIHIVTESKTPEKFNEIRQGHDPKQTYMIGNSLNSDIAPAIAAKIKGIYIPRGTWSYELEKDEKLQELLRHPDVIQTQPIKNLIKLYPPL